MKKLISIKVNGIDHEMAIGKEGNVPIIPSVSGAHNLAEWVYLFSNFEKTGAAIG